MQRNTSDKSTIAEATEPKQPAQANLSEYYFSPEDDRPGVTILAASLEEAQKKYLTQFNLS